ncbi:pentapeptide repeat-containing protein [Streptomyces sp. NPDC021093]|uniref:pentapeptide repeat-containing protein n=1 Tax=Streptomyces sp. NPDC021093 TaxID=3365112 RepID=UPI0037A02629
MLKRSLSDRNQWRTDNPDIKPDLTGADLPGTNLLEANFTGADLTEANLDGADLSCHNHHLCAPATAGMTVRTTATPRATGCPGECPSPPCPTGCSPAPSAPSTAESPAPSPTPAVPCSGLCPQRSCAGDPVRRLRGRGCGSFRDAGSWKCCTPGPSI